MPILVLVRHGQSTWNLENRFTGETDIPLTEQGRDEARVAGEKLREIPFGHGFTSILQRAIDTMHILLEAACQTQLPVTRDHALNERNYGRLQGLNKKAVAEQFGEDQVARWRRSFSERPPGGESLADTAGRVIPYYERVIGPMLRQGLDVLVVAHGNSLRALVMHLEDLSEEAIAGFDLPTGVPRRYRLSDSLEIEGVAYL
jgi:2,3-bisphosphoglycerate-dependent phosphoglycerate mutase